MNEILKDLNMSSLIYLAQEQQIMVLTDTLALEAPAKVPYKFVSKALVLPHLRMIVAATGQGGILGKWFNTLNDNFIIESISDLNYETTNYLKNLWSTVRISNDSTVTLYNFGFTHDNKIQIKILRSENDFQIEIQDPPAIASKPYVDIPDNLSWPTDIAQFMEQQRTNDLSLPQNEQLGIGGKMNVIHLHLNGFSIWDGYTFNSYQETWKEILNNNY
jgi:hypothetical protein